MTLSTVIIVSFISSNLEVIKFSSDIPNGCNLVNFYLIFPFSTHTEHCRQIGTKSKCVDFDWNIFVERAVC